MRPCQRARTAQAGDPPDGTACPQNLTVVKKRTPRPGISTSSFLKETWLRISAFKRLVPTSPKVRLWAPDPGFRFMR